MMGKNITLILLIFLFYVKGNSQTTTINKFVHFSTTNQSMFGLDTNINLNFELELFNMPWNQSFSSNHIDTTAIGKYGFQMSGLTQGHFSSTFYSRNWEMGDISVDYPANVEIKYPSNSSFEKGETITINTDYTVDPSANITTVFPEVGNVGLELGFSFRFQLAPILCFLYCTDPNTFGFDTGLLHDTLTIFDVSDERLRFACVSPTLTCDRTILPITADLPFGFSGDFRLPTVNTSSSIGIDKCLYATGEDKYAGIQLEIFDLIGALNIPYVSPVLDALSGGGCYGDSDFSDSTSLSTDVCFEYTLFSAAFEMGVTNKQQIAFCPELYTSFTFPTPVQYTVTDPNAGNAIVQGPLQSDTIKIKVGNDLNIKYPCNFEYMDIQTDHDISNTLRNHTYDSISFDFTMEALSALIRLDGFLVGEWFEDTNGNINDAVWTFGPLFRDSIPLGSFPGVDWYDETWELPGFNDVPGDLFKLVPREFSAQTIAHTDVDCYGENDGSFTVQVTNGTAPYTYNWSDASVDVSSATNISNDSLDNNNHYVVIEDNNGCMAYASQYIEGPTEAIQITSTLIEPINCKSANDGSITITVFGGTPPYSYVWSTGTGTTTATNVNAGNQSVTITDSKGCTHIENFIMPEPDSITALFDITHVTCFGGDNGVVEVIPAGGVAPFSYNWSNGATTKTTNNWTAGSHNVIITDINGCSSTVNFTINQPTTAVVITGTTNNISCYGFNDGSINVSISGGTAPYTYQWSDSNFNLHVNTTNSITNLYPSNWNLTITDSNGCIARQVFAITQPAIELSLNDTAGNVSCKNGNDGFVDLSPYGGTAPYSYAWNNGATSQDINNLIAGSYSVTITDANGCTLSSSYVITEPVIVLSLATNQLNVTCKNDSNGSAQVVASGGSPGYSYLWNTGDTVSAIDSLVPGNYSVQVTDEEGCVQNIALTITEPDSLLITGVMDSVTCHSFADGKITVNVTGGTIPYQMAFGDSTLSKYNTGNVTFFDSLIAAHYFISVVDTNGCMYTKTMEVLEPDTLSWSITTTDVSCYGGNDGFADLSIWGGTTPYTQTWDDTLNATTEDLSNAYSGDYLVTIVDRNGCTVVGDAFISQPDSITIEDTTYTTTCVDNDDGKIEIFVNGGIAGYSYLWSNSEVTQNIYNLSAGEYYVDVTDANGCHQYDTLLVNISYENCLIPPTAFTPDGDGYNDTWILQNIENYEGASIKVFNKWGKIIFESGHDYTPWDGTFGGKILPAATYYYIIDLNTENSTPYTGPVTIVKKK